MIINERETHRGFALLEFTDAYGAKCSLQKSSAACDAVWFGVDDADPKVMASKAASHGLTVSENEGWVPFPIPAEVLLTTRMHLTREQVAALLPALKRFAKTGQLSRREGAVAARFIRSLTHFFGRPLFRVE